MSFNLPCPPPHPPCCHTQRQSGVLQLYRGGLTAVPRPFVEYPILIPPTSLPRLFCCCHVQGDGVQRGSVLQLYRGGLIALPRLFPKIAS